MQWAGNDLLQLGKRACPWAHFSTRCPRQELQIGQGIAVAGVTYDNCMQYWASLCLFCHGQLQLTVIKMALRSDSCQFQRNSGLHERRGHTHCRWGVGNADPSWLTDVDWNNTGSCFIHWQILIQRPVLAGRYNATLLYPMLEWPLGRDSSLVSFPVKCEYQYVPFYCNIIKFFLYIKMCDHKILKPVAVHLVGLLPLWTSHHWYRLYCTWHHIPQHCMFHIL